MESREAQARFGQNLAGIAMIPVWWPELANLELDAVQGLEGLLGSTRVWIEPAVLVALIAGVAVVTITSVRSFSQATRKSLHNTRDAMVGPACSDIDPC